MVIKLPDRGTIERILSTYARVKLSPPLEGLDEGDRKAVEHLIKAAKVADELYMRQYSYDGPAILEELKKSGADREYIEAILINGGPYEVFNDEKRFIGDGPPQRLPGEAIYEKGIKREEIDEFLEKHPEKKDEILAIDTVVLRDDGGFRGVKYSEYYGSLVQKIVREMRLAAEATGHEGFRNYLLHRAEALESGKDLYDTDVEWLSLRDNPVDFVVGPIETYIDNLYGLKGAYQAMVLVRDFEETKRLQMYLDVLDELERKLPLPEEYLKSGAQGGNAIEVFNAVYFGGEPHFGGKPMAHNLPNDERITAKYGNKNQMFSNIIKAKAEMILKPIASIVISPEQRKFVTPQAFFNHTILHELSHTLGPSYKLNDGKTPIRECLKDRYSAIEEAKADVLGMWSMTVLREKGIYSDRDVTEGFVTHIASMFRSMRFGLGSAHAKANIIQIEYLMAKGGIEFTPSGFILHQDEFESSLVELARELLETKLYGDYDRAGRILDDYGNLDPEIEAIFERLKDIPIDIALVD